LALALRYVRAEIHAAGNQKTSIKNKKLFNKELYQKIGDELGVGPFHVFHLLTGQVTSINGYPGLYADLQKRIDGDLDARLFQKLEEVIAGSIHRFEISKEFFAEQPIRSSVPTMLEDIALTGAQQKALVCLMEAGTQSLKGLSAKAGMTPENFMSRIREILPQIVPALDDEMKRRAIFNIASRRRGELFRHLAGYLQDFSEELEDKIRDAVKSARGIDLEESAKIELLRHHLYHGATFRALGDGCGKSADQVRRFFQGVSDRRVVTEGAIGIMRRFLSRELTQRTALITRQLKSAQAHYDGWIAAFEQVFYRHMVYQVPFAGMYVAMSNRVKNPVFVSDERPSRDTVEQLMRRHKDLTFFGPSNVLERLGMTGMDCQAIERWQQWSRINNHEDEWMAVRVCQHGLVWMMLPESRYRANMTHALSFLPLRSGALILPVSWQEHLLLTVYETDRWPSKDKVSDKTGILGFFMNRPDFYKARATDGKYVLATTTTGHAGMNRIRYSPVKKLWVKEHGVVWVEMYEDGQGLLKYVRIFSDEAAHLDEKGVIDVCRNRHPFRLGVSEEEALYQHVVRWMDDVLEKTRDGETRRAEELSETIEWTRNHYLEIFDRFNQLKKTKQNVYLKDCLKSLEDVLDESDRDECRDRILERGNSIHARFQEARDRWVASLDFQWTGRAYNRFGGSVENYQRQNDGASDDSGRGLNDTSDHSLLSRDRMKNVTYPIIQRGRLETGEHWAQLVETIVDVLRFDPEYQGLYTAMAAGS